MNILIILISILIGGIVIFFVYKQNNTKIERKEEISEDDSKNEKKSKKNPKKPQKKQNVLIFNWNSLVKIHQLNQEDLHLLIPY